MQPTPQFNNSANDRSRISFLVGYLFFEKKIKDFLNITNSYDFTNLTALRKNLFLIEMTKKHHKYQNVRGLDSFFSPTKNFYAVLEAVNNKTRVFNGRVQRLFVPRFYHDRRNINFLRELKFKGEKKEIDIKGFSEEKLLGRKLYKYASEGNYFIRTFNRNNLDWPFPDKFYSSTGLTVHGFPFTFKNSANNLSIILNPSNDLINVESGLEEVENTLIDELFYSVKKIKEKIKEYNVIPTNNYINKSYFLYDKSNLIKKNICYCY